jgi:NAD(P)-dependent dehydrogenase (short-subunit alcohol dehydrogenase family)
MRKIVVVGATGTIGKTVADLLSFSPDNKIIRVGNRYGEYNIDLRSKLTIENLFQTIGNVDGVICTAGNTRFGNAFEASINDFIVSISNKLLSQINLVQVAVRHLNPNGFITLTSGSMSQTPWPDTAPAAMVNAGIEGFMRAAARDMENGIRINAVSPVIINTTAKKMGLPTTTGTMSQTNAARIYQISVDGDMTGQVIDAGQYGLIETEGDKKVTGR